MTGEKVILHFERLQLDGLLLLLGKNMNMKYNVQSSVHHESCKAAHLVLTLSDGVFKGNHMNTSAQVL